MFISSETLENRCNNSIVELSHSTLSHSNTITENKSKMTVFNNMKMVQPIQAEEVEDIGEKINFYKNSFRLYKRIDSVDINKIVNSTNNNVALLAERVVPRKGTRNEIHVVGSL